MTPRTLRLLALGAGLAAAGGAQAQDAYPERTINLMVGFTAGGNVDIISRQVEPFLEKHLGGADIAVVNRPGAGSALMQTELANAEPDGYTLGMLSFPTVAALLFGRDTQYEIDDFAYIGTFTYEPHSLFVGMDSPYETLDGMLEAAEADPGSVTIGGAGIGSSPHLAMKLLERESGQSFNYIPTPGTAEMRNQVMGGHLDSGITTVSVSVPMKEEGQGRVLGVMAEERLSIAEDVPTMLEQGYDVQWGALRGIAAPVGTPPEIVQKLSDALVATMEDPEFIALAERDSQLLHYLDPAGFEASAKDQYDRLEAIWNEDPWLEQ